MEIIRSIAEMQQIALKCKQKGKKVGFVPTMGFLHEGHERLMEEAKKENDVVVTSIFVNPLQFGPNEDFDRYPRDEVHDIKISEDKKVDFLFLPEHDDMYPSNQSVTMQVVNRTNVLCGRTRDGHFAGVVTVLTKLFHIILPDNVYFGLKDAQQVAVVDSLVNDFNFPLKVVPVSTVREKDGLAKSSRNVYLSNQERENAPYIYQGLQFGQKKVIDGEKNPAIIVKEVENYIVDHTHGKIDYVELLSYPELTPIDKVDQQVILAVAVQFDRARLIDNLVFDQNGKISGKI